MELFDVSMRLDAAMLSWPTGRVPLEQDVWGEGPPRDSDWRIYSHAGTHVDAPSHWLPGAPDVDGIPLAACLGPCVVVGVAEDRLIEPRDLPPLAEGMRILFRTPNSDLRLDGAPFDDGFAALGPDAATTLAEARIALVGIDYLSVERPGEAPGHRALLAAGVVLLEGLDLRGVGPGEYQLSALPLRLPGGEASPVRAVLWR
jgi:arylformamidase